MSQLSVRLLACIGNGRWLKLKRERHRRFYTIDFDSFYRTTQRSKSVTKIQYGPEKNTKILHSFTTSAHMFKIFKLVCHFVVAVTIFTHRVHPTCRRQVHRQHVEHYQHRKFHRFYHHFSKYTGPMDSCVVGRRDNPLVVEVPVGDVKNLDSCPVFSI